MKEKLGGNIQMQILNTNHRASPFVIIFQKRKSVYLSASRLPTLAGLLHFYLIVSPRGNTFWPKESTK